MSDNNKKEDKKKEEKKEEEEEDEEVTLVRKGTMGRTVADAQEFLSDFDPSTRKRKREEREKEKAKEAKEVAKRLAQPKKKKASPSPTRRSLSPKKKQTSSRSPSRKKKNNSNSSATKSPPPKKRITRSSSPKKNAKRVTRKSPGPIATNIPTTFPTNFSSLPPSQTPATTLSNWSGGSAYSGFSFAPNYYNFGSIDQLNFWIPNGNLEGNKNIFTSACWSSFKGAVPTWSFTPSFPDDDGNTNSNNQGDDDDDGDETTEKKKQKKAAFGLTVSSYGKVWIGNDNGDVYGFSLDGEMKRRIKLPSGIKSIVADMDNWLYAGCDDGVVYDLSREKEVRIAYEIDSSIALDKQEEIEFLTGASESTKCNHFVFVVDKSGSMAGSRIRAAMNNIRMIYDHHIKDDDYISLIDFSSSASIRCSKWQKSDKKQRSVMEKFFFSTKADHVCGGATALWDALHEALNILSSTTTTAAASSSSSTPMDIDASNPPTTTATTSEAAAGGGVDYDNSSNSNNMENWIICLTDGEDNSSRKTNFYNLFERFKTLADSLKIIGIGVGLSSYGAPLKSICQINQASLYIPVEAANAAEGITEAFKLVTQLLSSRIISMDIRDGLIAVSDNRGNLSACDIEAHPTWTKRSKGVCGWMIKADFEGLYHGHSLGITKYNPFDGTTLWERSFSSPILYGFLDRKNNVIYASAGSNVYVIETSSGGVRGYFKCPGPVICNAFDYDKQRIFAVDKVGNLVCFNSLGVLLFLVKFPGVLAMQYFKDLLFLTTTEGKLHCLDVSDAGIQLMKVTGGATTVPPPQTKQVSCLESLEVTIPTTSIPSRSKKELDEDDVIVECYQEFNDAQILSISNSLHDTSVSVITVNSVEYPISVYAPTAARYCKISRLTFLQHAVGDHHLRSSSNNANDAAEYDQMDKVVQEGGKVTWVLNGEKELSKRGLVVNSEVKRNGSHLLIRPLPNQKGGYDSSKIVQFPRSLRSVGTFYSVQNLSLSENGHYYRSFGEISLITDYST